MLNKNYCMDCGNEISPFAKRCIFCSNKERANRSEEKRKMLGNQNAKGYKWTKKQKENLDRKGKNAPNYVDGRWLEKHYCIDCGKEISNQGSKRCYSCDNKIKMEKRWQNPNFKKEMSGKNCNLYKDGRTIGIHYCMDCGKEISQYYCKRCHSCDTKQHWEKGDFDGVFVSPTKPEKEIMKILEKLELDYIFQFRPKEYSRPYDFYLPELNLLIEFDGIYWHSLPGMQKRDIEKTEYAENNGYDLLRFNEKTLSNFKSSILGAIGERER